MEGELVAAEECGAIARGQAAHVLPGANATGARPRPAFGSRYQRIVFGAMQWHGKPRRREHNTQLQGFSMGMGG